SQLGITMASLGIGWLGEPTLAQLFEPLLALLPPATRGVVAQLVVAALAFAIITSLHTVLGEQAPKVLALRRPETTGLFVIGVSSLFVRLFSPAIRLLNGASSLVLRLVGAEVAGDHSRPHSPEEIMMLVDASHQAGEFDPDERLMIGRVFEF